MDQVHDMMDDIAEQQDVAREISDAISNPVAFGEFSMSNEHKHNAKTRFTNSAYTCRSL